jgi:Reverse transcriptase (RNA-dependent DNA polymerase)/RNase H-like domain found in reverse transcriptase
MPHLESELAKLQGSTCFATFDLSYGYFQLPLAPDSRECQSFITPDGVFSPTRVLHGTTNAVSHMQAVLQEILLPSVEQILAWLDDILLHAVTELELLTHFRALFLIFRQYNIMLHPGKCSIYATKLRWCGRILSATGFCFDPRRVQGLRDMEPSSTCAELQQFVCARNWMRTSLQMFAQLIAPLQAILERVYQAALEHPSLDKRLCLYTDASLEFWSSVITQVPPADLDCPAVDERHKPLAFLSGKFTRPMRCWPIIEK